MGWSCSQNWVKFNPLLNWSQKGSFWSPILSLTLEILSNLMVNNLNQAWGFKSSSGTQGSVFNTHTKESPWKVNILLSGRHRKIEWSYECCQPIWWNQTCRQSSWEQILEFWENRYEKFQTFTTFIIRRKWPACLSLFWILVFKAPLFERAYFGPWFSKFLESEKPY